MMEKNTMLVVGTILILLAFKSFFVVKTSGEFV